MMMKQNGCGLTTTVAIGARSSRWTTAFIPSSRALLRRSFDLLIQQRIKTRDQIRLDLPYSVGDVEELAALPRGFLTGDILELPVSPKIRNKIDSEHSTEQATLIPILNHRFAIALSLNFGERDASTFSRLRSY